MGRNEVKKLLFSITPKDCELQTFTVHGPGGGGKDTSNTGVRYIHEPSGAVGEAREERSQPANKRAAWKRLALHPKMQAWIKQKAAVLAGQPTIEELVEKAVEPRNLKVEVRGPSGWENWNETAD
jgi:protein subunit release factor B